MKTANAAQLRFLTLVLTTLLLQAGCPLGEDGPFRKMPGACNVALCKQVDHYESGHGAAGADTITVECVEGPPGATVSNRRNGEYVVTGTYTLGMHDTARIELHWGGTTEYSNYEGFTIPQKGSGEFTLRVMKVAGGAGNMFLTMSSGGRRMFDTVLVNAGCTSKSSASQETTAHETADTVDNGAAPAEGEPVPAYDAWGLEIVHE